MLDFDVSRKNDTRGEFLLSKGTVGDLPSFVIRNHAKYERNF